MSRYALGYVAPLPECPEINDSGIYWDRSKEEKYTAEFVRKRICYFPDTGEFLRLVGKFPGKRAGYLNQFGYWSIKIGSDGFPAHRLAWLYMTGEWPNYQVDHKDLDRSNNRWSNLRTASHGQNQSNSKFYKNNIIGLKGVSSIPNRPGKFRSRIRKNGREISLGVWNSQEEAHKAYVEAAKKLHGEFWRV